MRFLRLTLAYDGTDYFGWQWQTGMRTVQQVLEQAIQQVTGETLRVVAAGRTDTGVHALGQVVSFPTESSLSNEVLRRALNTNLPQDVCVLEVESAPDGFHAIDDSQGKRYRYLIQDGRNRDVFARRYAWRVWRTLDVPAMHLAAQGLLGQHDFGTFQNVGSPRVSTVRTVREIQVERHQIVNGERIVIEVEADGFLYNMVRNIVGTLVEVGKGNQGVDWPAQVLAARDRTVAGMCAPAHGLYLLKVFYKNDQVRMTNDQGRK
jgi:tRNA pseudouridine38-40 synthase